MNQKLMQFWNHKWLLSLTAGLLLGLSFPPFPLPMPFLQFPALLCLFRLVSLSDSAKQAAYFIYPGFLIWNLMVSYWLMMASLPAGIAAILANGVLMGLVVMLQFTAQKKLKNAWLIALLQASFWVGFEYLHHQWDLSWPWLTLANGWANMPVLVQYISFTGFWGISFWVMFSSALFYQSIQRDKRILRIGSVAIFVLFPLLSLIQSPFVSTQSEDTVEIVVGQPNFDSYNEFGGFSTSQDAVSHLLNLSDSVRTPNTDLIIWPENGIHPNLSNRNTSNVDASRSKNRLRQTASEWNTPIVGGTAFYEFYERDDYPPLPQWSGETPFLTYNAAVGLYPDGGMHLYRKHNLVPVVERFPFVHFFNAVDVFGWVDWAEIQNFGKGDDPDQFAVANTKTPALICYDSVYPSWIRTFVQNGAGFITVITNDGWWGDTSGHEQHFAYARLRALEFRRWVVRSANNGISGIISPDGAVKIRTEYWTKTAFNYDVPVLKELTFYARFGDWLPQLLLMLSFGGVIYFIINRE